VFLFLVLQNGCCCDRRLQQLNAAAAAIGFGVSPEGRERSAGALIDICIRLTTQHEAKTLD
jgi:hypothetical protein